MNVLLSCLSSKIFFYVRLFCLSFNCYVLKVLMHCKVTCLVSVILHQIQNLKTEHSIHGSVFIFSFNKVLWFVSSTCRFGSDLPLTK